MSTKKATCSEWMKVKLLNYNNLTSSITNATGNFAYNLGSASYNLLTSNSTKDSIQWLLKRLPNPEEAFTQSAIKVIAEMGIEGVSGTSVNEAFGENPSTRTIVRNGLKLPSIYVSDWLGIEIGGTGIKYDDANTLASNLKFVCQIALLGSFWGSQYVLPRFSAILPQGNYWSRFQGAFGGVTIEVALRASNYICEIPARFVSIQGKNRQLEDKRDTPITEYIMQNTNAKIIFQAISSATFKTMVTDIIGEKIIKPLGLGKHANNHAYWAHNSVFQAVAQDAAELSQLAGPSKTIWQNLGFYLKALDEIESSMLDQLAHVKVIGTTVASEFLAKVLQGVVTTYLLATPARIIQDSVEELIATEYAQQLIKSIHDLPESIQNIDHYHIKDKLLDLFENGAKTVQELELLQKISTAINFISYTVSNEYNEFYEHCIAPETNSPESYNEAESVAKSSYDNDERQEITGNINEANDEL